jgi:hypothetical protein
VYELKKLFILLTIIVVFAAVLLAGCNGNNDNNLTLKSTTSSTSPTVSTPDNDLNNDLTGTSPFNDRSDILNDDILNTEDGKISDHDNQADTAVPGF